MNRNVVAYVDMRPNLLAATVIAIIGVCVVVLLSRRKVGSGNNSQMGTTGCLIAGPVIAVTPWAADVFVYHRDIYPTAVPGRCSRDAFGHDPH